MSQLFTAGGKSIGTSAFSISTSSEYSGWISFRIVWFELLAVQGTLKNLLQHHNLKASIIWHSAFFTVQLSHPYMITGKTIPLTLAFLVAQMVKNLPAVQETWVQSLGQKNPLEKGMTPVFLPVESMHRGA